MDNELDELLQDVSESKSVDELKEKFLQRKSEEEQGFIKDYVKDILDADMRIKEIQEEKKQFKTEAKENGVDVTKVNKVIRNIKEYLKESGEDVKEIQLLEEIVSSDTDIKTMIANLVK